MRSIFRRLITLGAWALIVGSLTAWVSPIWSVVSVAEHLKAGWAFLAVAVMLGSAITRQWRWLGIALAVCLVHAWPVARTWAPDIETLTGRPLTVVSWNLRARNTDIGRIAAQIWSSRADVVVLQEVSAAHEEALDALRSVYPWQAITETPNGNTLALLSRRRWLANGVAAPSEASAQPPLIWARLRGPNGPVTVAGVHLVKPFDGRRHVTEVESVARWMASTQTPVVLVGDFNATPWSSALDRLSSTGLRRVSGGWPTWPGLLGWVGLSIDHAFLSPELALTRFERLRAAGSDHRALRVQVGRRAKGLKQAI